MVPTFRRQGRKIGVKRNSYYLVADKGGQQKKEKGNLGQKGGARREKALGKEAAYC